MDSFSLFFHVTMENNRKFKELLVLGLEVGSLQNKKHVKPLHPHVNLKNRVISFGNGLNKWFHNYSMIKTVCNTEFTEINLSHRPHFLLTHFIYELSGHWIHISLILMRYEVPRSSLSVLREDP